MKYYLYLLSILFLFSGCKPSFITINSRYDDVFFSQKKLLICPLDTSSIFVYNKDDVIDDFPDDTCSPEIVISHSLFNSLCINTDSFLKEIITINDSLLEPVLSGKKDSSYFCITKILQKDTLQHTFYIPVKKYLESHNYSPDLILVIDRVEFGRNLSFDNLPRYAGNQTIQTPGGSFNLGPVLVGGGGTESLGVVCDFILYSYEDEDIISYGSIDAKTSFAFAMTDKTWAAAFKTIFLRVFNPNHFKYSLSKNK